MPHPGVWKSLRPIERRGSARLRRRSPLRARIWAVFLEFARELAQAESRAEMVPESHPSDDPALEQVFALHPPLLLARPLDEAT